MEEYPQSQEIQAAELFVASQTRRWLVVAGVLLVAAVVAIVYGYREHSKLGEMASQANENQATIVELHNQVNTLNSKLNEMIAAQSTAAAASIAPAASEETPASPSLAAVVPKPKRTIAVRKRAPREDALKQLQARLDAQQKQLDATEDEVAKNRSDLQGTIDSTRDELNGSIAKNHDELVALEKRGERAYFEFDLTKSKQFQHTGPLMLSLRKADTKHKSYDLALIVDDNQMSKKHVDLYEPIWLHAGNDVQPVQIVVNQIEKDHIHGYVSAPKYAEAHQQADGNAAAPSSAPAPQAPAASPVSGNSSTPSAATP